MDRTFSVVLSELRKEKGINQKTAAAELGISQALLSHYERGIRECSLDFLLRAAEYYGVTCDYLLGRDRSRTGFNEGFSAEGTIPGDSELSPLTLFRACAVLRESLDGESAEDFDSFNTLALYYYLLSKAGLNALPNGWSLNDKKAPEDFLGGMALLAARNLSSLPSKPRKAREEKEPQCIKTVCRHAEMLIKDYIKKQGKII